MAPEQYWHQQTLGLSWKLYWCGVVFSAIDKKEIQLKYHYCSNGRTTSPPFVTVLQRLAVISSGLPTLCQFCLLLAFLCNVQNKKLIKARYGPTTMASAFQLLNLFGIFWGVFFVEAFGQVEHVVLPKSLIFSNSWWLGLTSWHQLHYCYVACLGWRFCRLVLDIRQKETSSLKWWLSLLDLILS